MRRARTTVPRPAKTSHLLTSTTRYWLSDEHPVLAVSSVMIRRMLNGIRGRAERRVEPSVPA